MYLNPLLETVTTNTSSFLEPLELLEPPNPNMSVTRISKQIHVKSIYPFITILYFMAKFVETDEKIKFKNQTEEKIGAGR